MMSAAFSRPRAPTASVFFSAAALFGVAVLILYPTAGLVIASFSDAPPGEGGRMTLANFAAVLTDASLAATAWRTVWVSAVATLYAVTAGGFTAWLVARTDLPGRRAVEVLATIPFLLPPVLAAISWAALGNPDNGLLNQLFPGGRLLDLYSTWGIAFVLGQHGAGFVFVMMVVPLRNADPSLEDAARLSGASSWQLFKTIQFPLIAPVLLPLAILCFVRAVESFEVAVILGTPAKVFLLTNEIYYRLHVISPPEYGIAMAMSCLVTLAMGALLVAQTQVASRRSYMTVTGKGYRPRTLALGRWTVPCCAVACAHILVATILPIAMIILASFSRYFGIYDPAMLTTANYTRLLADPLVQRAVANTVLLMASAATAAIVIGAATAYIVKRILPRMRPTMDAVTLVPWAMPGLVFGLAMLWAYISVPGFYGTLLVLFVAYMTLGLPIGVRAMAGVLGQISNDLTDASRVHGASALQTLRYTLLPLIWPGIVAGWFVLATIFSRELAASVLLYGPDSEVLSVVLLGFWEQGRGNAVAVLCVLMLAILLGLFAIERIVAGRRVTLASRAG